MKTILLIAALATISTTAIAEQRRFDAGRKEIHITEDNHVTIKDLKSNRVTHTGKCDGGGCTLRDPRTGKTTIIMRDFIEPYRGVRR